MTPQDRLNARLRPSNGCLLWTGATYHGYGRLRVDGRTVAAHVLAWELVFGPVPAGRELDHLCRNRACCNPWHLEPVTHAVNVARSPRVGRTGCAHGALVAFRRNDGKMDCRTCLAERQARYRARKSA